MSITLQQLNKQTKQKITVEDLSKIDSNSTIIQNAINSLPTSTGSTVTTSTTNGNIKINDTESVVYIHPSGTNPHGTTATDVGLGNVTNESKTTMFTNPTFTGSIKEGTNTIASGFSSHAEGQNTTASGAFAHSEGMNTLASGAQSHAGGMDTIAKCLQYAMGQFNTISASSDASYNATGEALIIGNGTSTSARGNAFKVMFDGKTYADGAYTSTGADYSEYFEWEDGNVDNEDRVGYFVTWCDSEALSNITNEEYEALTDEERTTRKSLMERGQKIRKSTFDDTDILGVVSATPSVVGDNYEAWQNKYITDEWGRIQYEDVIIPATYQTIDNKQVLISKEHIDKQPIYNPEWDSSQEYISRENRPEWSAIGMMGKLLVRDDGTCKVNGYCKPNDEGIATSCYKSSIIKYRVMKRVNDNIVQVLIK